LDDLALLRYSRHILLPEIDVRGQECISQAHVLIVGAGGLGSPAALYLAAAGVGRLTLVDDDDVDLTNLQRQVLHSTSNIGRPKVHSAQARLAEINPLVIVHALHSRLAEPQLSTLLQNNGITLVLDCCDNFATRHAVNRACVQAKVPLVSGAGIRFDGQISVYDPRREDSPCYHCLFPEDNAPEEVRCAVMGVFSPITGVIGTLQAMEALKMIIGIGSPLVGRLLMLDGLGGEFNQIHFKRQTDCRVCGTDGTTRTPNTAAAPTATVTATVTAR
jgi:adenylyltransferase/sulfurtransferase